VPLKLSGRQLAIMKVLWERGESTVADVQSILPVKPRLAYSTVATMLSRMEKRGLVRHREEGRTYYYHPAISEGNVVGEIVNRVFHGQPSELVSHLLETSQVDQAELERIKQLIREHEAARQNDRKEST
jgi:BlaI family transcriptional regulator, penicillinase repressor